MHKLSQIILVSASVGAILAVPASALAQTPTVTVTPRPGLRDEIRDRVQKFIGRHGVLVNSVLTAKNGTTLTVTKDGKTYTVNTDSHTQLRRRFWGKTTLDEMSVNDQLNIYGKWTDDARTTLQATLIRDMSIQKRFGVFIGTITAINGNTWTVNTVARGTQTVTITGTPKFTNRKGQTLSQSDIVVGHRIRIRGLWDRTANTITEVSAVKDFSLPVQTSPTPTP